MDNSWRSDNRLPVPRTDENGKIKTATQNWLRPYEGGKVRDVAYDSNYPLKRVVHLHALNIEATKDWLEKIFGN